MITRIVNKKQIRNRGQLSGARGGAMQCFRNSALPFLGLFLLLSLSLSCGRKAPAPAPDATASPAKQPPSVVPPAVIPSEDPSPKSADADPAPALKTKAAPNKLDLGLSSFRAGDYGGAAQLFEEYVRDSAHAANRDLALFHLFLSRRLLDNSGRSARKAEEALRQIMTESPNSPYRDIVEYILSLQAQIESLKSDGKEKEARIKQLSDELLKLKEIDMQRRPSKPLY